jgi:hypothetical protein
MQGWLRRVCALIGIQLSRESGSASARIQAGLASTVLGPSDWSNGLLAYGRHEFCLVLRPVLGGWASDEIPMALTAESAAAASEPRSTQAPRRV